MSKTPTKISKLISYWLRHKPEDANIELDEFGWADIDDILKALRANHIESTKNDLITLSNSFDKVRWKIDHVTNRIKATHGHSISILQELEPHTPPEILYHGTATKFLESIMSNGLLSKSRQYVHLSETIEMAKEIGSRHGKAFIIEIDTKRLIDQGWKFYKTEQNVWLTIAIPTQYLDFEPWNFNIDKETNDSILEELRKEIGRTDKLDLIARYGPSDDFFLKNRKTNEHLVVHLTWSGKKEKEGWPTIERYKNFRDFIDKRLVTDQLNWYL